MNIVSMAAQFLAPTIVEKIASSLGITSPLAQKAIGALLPAIFGGILGTSSKASGLESLGKVLGQQDSGFLGNIGNILGGAGQANAVSTGTDMLGSLLGNSAVGSLAGAAAKFAGIGDGPAKSLVGMLAPVALGTIAQQQKAQNLDIGGVARMLSGQKDNITAAMPSGFSDLLKGTGLLDSIAPAAAPRAATSTTSSSTSTSQSTSYSTPSAPASGNTSWLPWAAGLALLALGGWYFLGGSGSRQVALPAAPKILAGTQDIGSQLGSTVEGLRATLGGVKDEASAKAALPRLQETAKQLETLSGLRGQLPADAKKSLATYSSSLLPALRPLIDRVLGTTGVAAVLKPVLDQIISRIDGMSKA